MQRGNVSNYNQIAFLFRSVKSEEAVEIGTYLEENGIPVYSPRSELFFERKEVKQLLGCLLRCFRSYLCDLKYNHFRSGYVISDKMRRYYIGCLGASRDLLKANAGLNDYLRRTEQRICDLQEESDFGLLDIFYHLIAFEPFCSYMQVDLKANVVSQRAARNLLELSRMLSHYSSLHQRYHLSKDDTVAMEFFNIYLKYLCEDGIGEYEDESKYAPKGCVSFMTIHQSKGLEFPVVVTGSLVNVPKRAPDPLLYLAESRYFHRSPFEPLADIKFFDFWRLYYTAFSRAQNLLVLAAKKRDGKYFGNWLRALPDIEAFRETCMFSAVKTFRYKRVYSFTSHVSVYDGCPKQYQYYKEYGFAQDQMFHTSVGSLVHATLEDVNRCILGGNPDFVTEASIEKWFLMNDQSMREQTGYFLSDEQRKHALRQVLCYYRCRKNELGKVWKAEEEIHLVLPESILQGVVDLIEGQGDTVEILDYKTGPKPDIEGHPERVAHYRKQLEIYAYLVEKKYGKKVGRMHLYYTNAQDQDPLISFEWTRNAVEQTVDEVSETIRKIEKKDFDGDVTNDYACKFCDMKYLCKKAVVL